MLGRLLLLGLAASGLFLSAPARAECGGTTQCIGVGPTAADAQTAGVGHHVGPAFDLGTPLFTLNFGNQVIATTSATLTIHVAAVTGAGTATLGAITIAGADAASFAITGGTCLTTNPVHGGPTCTITVNFSPATLGPKTARVDIPLNPPGGPGLISGRSVGLTGTGTVAAPAATATTMSVQFNTATTLNMAPFISGTAPLTIGITAAPANGTATVSGTSITYTPNLNYVGPDAFSYATTNAGGTSAPAVVTVTVQARADPGRDANVVGLISAQARTAASFARAQISNYQRRMESLHRSAVADSGTPAGAAKLSSGRIPGSSPNRAPGASAVTVATLGAGGSPVGAAIDLATGADSAASRPGRVVPGPDGSWEIGRSGAVSPVPASWLTSLLSVAGTGSLNVAHGTERTDGSSLLPEGTGLWVGGSIQFGTRDATSTTDSMRFTSDGVSAGFDRRFNDKLTLGMGLGYARGRTDIGTNGTQDRSSGTSIAAYGSYAPGLNTFVDGLIGYGVLDMDSDRYVAAVNDYARANRKGDQIFGSLAAGIEHVKDGLLLSPYGRLDFTVSRLDLALETGAGANALAYFDQTLQTLQFSLGLRAESRHATSFGWALPRLRAELKHDFKDDTQATVAYVDQFAGPRYSVTSPGPGRESMLVGLGSDFILRSGLKLGVDYQAERTFGSESSHAVRLWLASNLDGKSSLSGLSSSALFSNPVRVEAGYAWDDNLNRERSLKLSDHVYSLNVSKGMIVPMTSHTRVIASGFVSGDKLYTYNGLDRYSGGGQVEYQYRTSGEFDATTFGVFGRTQLDQFGSELRTGYRYSFGVNARQSLTDRIDLFGALAGNWRHADNVVFDAQDYSARFNLDYSLTGGGTPYISGEYRRGDTVSSGPQTKDSIAIAKAFVRDDAFGNNQFFAYRFEARTLLWTLGYNWPLGPRDAIDFSWRYVHSKPTDAPDYALAGPYPGVALGPASYTANQYSVVYLMRF